MNGLIIAAIVASIGFAAAALGSVRSAAQGAVILVVGGYLMLFANAHEIGIVGVFFLGILAVLPYAIPYWLGTGAGFWFRSRYPTQTRVRYGAVAMVFSCLIAYGGIWVIQEKHRERLEAKDREMAKQFVLTSPEVLTLTGDAARISQSSDLIDRDNGHVLTGLEIYVKGRKGYAKVTMHIVRQDGRTVVKLVSAEPVKLK